MIGEHTYQRKRLRKKMGSSRIVTLVDTGLKNETVEKSKKLHVSRDVAKTAEYTNATVIPRKRGLSKSQTESSVDAVSVKVISKRLSSTDKSATKNASSRKPLKGSLEQSMQFHKLYFNAAKLLWLWIVVVELTHRFHLTFMDYSCLINT